MKRGLLLVLMLLSSAIVAVAQRNLRITSDAAGGIRLGMTVGQARRALPNCSFRRTEDGEGIALIGVRCHKREIISLYAGEEDRDVNVNWRRRIEFIEIWDKRFKTKDGLHPGMYLRDAERVLGKVREILMTQIESREFVTFGRVRKGIEYRTYGGIYTRPNVTTTKYEPRSRIHSILVTKD